MRTVFKVWNSVDECIELRDLMRKEFLYESTFKNSRFKRFVDKGDCYAHGFSIILYDDSDQIIGLILSEIVEDLKMPGGVRKKTRDYGMSGKIIESLPHDFIILASIGMYIRPEFRGNNYSVLLLQVLESDVIPLFVDRMKFNYSDIPVFEFHEPLYSIASRTLNYSRPVRRSIDCSGLRDELHYWSIEEKPVYKFDPFPMKKHIKHWSELVQPVNTPDINFTV